MKLLMLFTIPHIPELNITNQYCTHSPCTLKPLQKGSSNHLPLLHLLPHPPDLPRPSGFKQDPLPDPKPRTSLHLSLPPPNGKNNSSLSLFCVTPPLVEWLAGFVMLLSGIVVLSGFMGCIKVHL